MIVPRNRRQAAALSLAASMAPTIGPLVRQGARAAFDYVTAAPAPSRTMAQVVRLSHEPKNLDQQSSSTLTGTTTPFSLLLNPINQGTGGNNRTGRQIQLEKLEFRLELTTDPLSLVDDTVRILVVWDRECRGSQIVAANVLTYNSTTDYQLVSPYVFDDVPNRLVVLHDEAFSLPTRMSPTTTTANTGRFTVSRALKLARRVHYYNTTGSGIVDIDSGSLTLFVFTQNSTHPSSLNLATRIVFRDL